jgi:Zn-dependent metalloprotease/PKD repeat protein
MDTVQRFYEFLNEMGNETGISRPMESFKITGTKKDKNGIVHIRSIQHFKGIEIYGSESILHIDNEKERFTGSFHIPRDNFQIDPAIDKRQAIEIAEEDLRKATSFSAFTEAEKQFLKYESPLASLIIFNRGKQDYALTWLITIRPNFVEEWKYFVDALNGKIIRRFNNTNSDGPLTSTGKDLNDMIRTFNVYLSAGIYYMYDISQPMYNPYSNEGIIFTLDANNNSTLNMDYNYVTSVDNTWTQQTAISAHCNATKTYQYFDTTFNRNSINGMGGNIISIVNVAADDGNSMENAFWNGQAIFYGNGGDNFKPIAGALDVTAHEMSHGVISSTANLEYYGQPGAINESFADIFACMVDRFDWKIGEDITRESYSPSGAIRDMSDPHNMGDSSNVYWQPAHTSEMYLGTDDNGGIHLNSGICNYAYYIFASKIGKNKAEQVYYRALTEYLTKTSGFIDLRIAVVQSARDLYGESSSEFHEAGWAFESVGIYEEEPVDVTAVYESNPGKELLLSYDTSPGDPVSLYESTSQGTNYRPLTNTPMTGKVSVTDDGKTAVFVSNDRRLRMINTGTPEINERIISGYNYYDRVAISKDGKRLAATRLFSDASVYVIDLVSGEGRQFMLYNPTTSSGNIDAGGVIKANSIEFDITGENLIYGAYNIINSNSQKDIYYWDIGIIEVWDNSLQQFGNGAISKLFTALPSHVNVSNPVFSNNSPQIIAFDYFYDDGVIEEYSVYGANLETGVTNQIVTNDRLGYPTFSTHDDKIAYSTINGSNTQVVKAIKLREDKITPIGDPGVLVPDAKWPVFFTSGIRQLGLAPVSNFTCDYKYGGLPLISRFFDLSVNDPVSWSWTFEGGDPPTSAEQNPLIHYEMPGYYKVTLATSNIFGSDTLVREQYIHAFDATPVDNTEAFSTRVFPNPVKDILNIISENNWQVKIYDLQGTLILREENVIRLDMSPLKPGVYILELQNKNRVHRQKLVKQ